MKKKAQVSEATGFVILVITVMFLIIIYRLFIASGSYESLGIISERHESERLKSGVNALFLMSDQKSGTTMLNLVGIAAILHNDLIYFGPTIGDVNVSDELIWRMDALFEKGHWRIIVPFPNETADIQMVIVSDTSGSMKDDIQDVGDNLPKLIRQLKDAGIKVDATVYLLGTRNIRCSMFPAEIIRCKSITQLNCDDLLDAQTEEDWGNGIACASRMGPDGFGWQQGAARIGIVLSDELSGGSECARNAACDVSGCTMQWQSVQNGIKNAIENQVTVFALKANADNVPQCSNRLFEWMSTLSNATGGSTYNLRNALQTSKAIEDIVGNAIPPDALNRIDVGSAPPERIRIRAYDLLVPTPKPGQFVKAYIYQWP